MKAIIITLFLFVVLSIQADTRWIPVSGTVEKIHVYETTDTILFELSNTGDIVTKCTNTTSFAIAGSVSADRRKQMLAMLLASKASSTILNAGYSDDDCVAWDSNANAYRRIRTLSQR